MLAGVRAAADGPDYVEGPISDDLRRLRGIDTTLLRAEAIRHEWDGVMALMDGSQPSVLHLYQERAEEHRSSEGWHYAHELSYQGRRWCAPVNTWLTGRTRNGRRRPNARASP